MCRKSHPNLGMNQTNRLITCFRDDQKQIMKGGLLRDGVLTPYGRSLWPFSGGNRAC